MLLHLMNSNMKNVPHLKTQDSKLYKKRSTRRNTLIIKKQAQTDSLTQYNKTTMALKNNRIVNHISLEYDNLIVNTQDILKYNHYNDDSVSSLGSISSAEEKDLQLLFRGAHKYRFDAIDFIKKFEAEKHQQEEKLQMEEKKYEQMKKLNKIKNYLLCRKGCFAPKLKKEKDKRGSREVAQDFVKNLTKSPLSPFKKVEEEKSDSLAIDESYSFSDSDKSKSDNSKSKSQNKKENTSALGAAALDKSHDHSQDCGDDRELGMNIAKDVKIGLKNHRRKSVQLSVSRMATFHKKSVSKEDNSLTSPKMDLKAGLRSLKSQLSLVDDDEEVKSALPEDFLQKLEDKRQFAHLDTFETENEDLQITDDMPFLSKLKIYQRRAITQPHNTKLIKFHFLVLVAWYIDFMITCLLLSNYRNIQKDPANSDFVYHREFYVFIIFIQLIDVIVNFFVVVKLENSEVNLPFDIAVLYLRNSFLADIITLIPWHHYQGLWAMIRLIRLHHYKKFEKYFDDFFIQQTEIYLRADKQKQLVDFFSLLTLVVFISHFFACIWIMIGLQKFIDEKDGWIYNNHQDNIQQLNYKSLYITGIYWVYTTFSSVGYGDVKGSTTDEYLFQMLVEITGMGFFGYMTGTLQQILQGVGQDDLKASQNEEIDYWLMSISRVLQNTKQMPSYIFQGVREYFNQSFKYNVMMIHHQEEFCMLKPRLQKQLQDVVYSVFYETFEDMFQGTEPSFRRKLIEECEYGLLRIEDEEQMNDYKNHWFANNENCLIQEAGVKSEHIYFIISGQIHIMNKEGIIEYGILSEGSYFGDLSFFFNEPNEFAYYLNPFKDKAFEYLSIKTTKFNAILESYTLAQSVFQNRADNRKNMFRSYKTIALLKIMKAATSLSQQMIRKKQMKLLEKVKLMHKIENKLNLCDQLYIFYDINRKIKQLKKSKAYINRRGAIINDVNIPDIKQFVTEISNSNKIKNKLRRQSTIAKPSHFAMNLKKADGEEIRKLPDANPNPSPLKPQSYGAGSRILQSGTTKSYSATPAGTIEKEHVRVNEIDFEEHKTSVNQINFGEEDDCTESLSASRVTHESNVTSQKGKCQNDEIGYSSKQALNQNLQTTARNDNISPEILEHVNAIDDTPNEEDEEEELEQLGNSISHEQEMSKEETVRELINLSNRYKPRQLEMPLKLQSSESQISSNQSDVRKYFEEKKRLNFGDLKKIQVSRILSAASKKVQVQASYKNSFKNTKSPRIKFIRHQSSEDRDDEHLKEGGASDQEIDKEDSPENSSRKESRSPSPSIIKIGDHLQNTKQTLRIASYSLNLPNPGKSVTQTPRVQKVIRFAELDDIEEQLSPRTSKKKKIVIDSDFSRQTAQNLDKALSGLKINLRCESHDFPLLQTTDAKRIADKKREIIKKNKEIKAKIAHFNKAHESECDSVSDKSPQEKEDSPETMDEYSSEGEQHTKQFIVELADFDHEYRNGQKFNVQQLQQYKVLLKKDIKTLLYIYIQEKRQLQKKLIQDEKQKKQRLQATEKLKNLKNKVNLESIHIQKKSNQMKDIRMSMFEGQKFGNEYGENDNELGLEQADNANSHTNQETLIGKEEHDYLDIIIDEFLNINNIDYANYQHNRKLRIKNALDDMAYAEFQKEQLFAKDIVSIPRNKIQKDCEYELLDNQLNMELEACKEDDLGIQDAIKKEYEQDKMFNQVKNVKLKKLNEEVQRLHANFEKQIHELKKAMEPGGVGK